MTGTGFRILLVGLVLASGLVGAVQTASVRVDVPDYVVTRFGGLDEVTIPGGRVLENEPGRPRVPYYTKAIEYPAGSRIQEVKLTGTGGSKTDSDLRLPAVSGDTTAIDHEEMTAGEYPTTDFHWDQLREPGRTVLLIHVFPFRYDPGKKAAKFRGNFGFEVTYVQSGVSIGSVDIDPPEIEPGSTASLTVQVESKDSAQAARAVLRVVPHSASPSGTDAFSRELQFEAPDTVHFEWSTVGLASGLYDIDVTVLDGARYELDRNRTVVRVGMPRGVVTGFDVSPSHFSIGDDISLELGFTNTGSSDLRGDCVFRILKGGELVDELVVAMPGMKPGGTRTFKERWSSDDAEESAVYTAVGFVRYEGTASESRSAAFSTNLMPTAAFKATPDTVAVGEEVTFDAAASKDDDGRLTNHRWEFGDGGTGDGVSVSHVWMQAGDFAVRLTVVDDKGRAGTAEKTIVVTE